MKHPKFTLELRNDFYNRYVIMEHMITTTTSEDGVSQQEAVASKQVSGHSKLEEALATLSMMAPGVIVLAQSAQEADNTFRI